MNDPHIYDVGVRVLTYQEEMQLFQSCDFSIFAPRVALCPAFAALRRGKSQPWAECFNPFGIAVTKIALPYL